MTKIKPFRLKPGDTIGVIAPASPVKGVCEDDVIQRGYAYLQDKGFNVIEGESLKKLSQDHTSASTEIRVNDIHDFLKDDQISCIMAFWGGLNSNQLLDHLDYDLIKNSRKLFVGFSDVTALTSAITTKTGLVTFSGPGVISFAKPDPFDYTWSCFEKMCILAQDVSVVPSKEFADDMYFLREDSDHRILKTNDGIKVFRGGVASGEVVAGNLQTLLVLAGTQYVPDMTNKILFIEDDETCKPAHIDRYLCQMHQLGWFGQIRGLVIGRFTEHSSFSAEDSLESLIGKYLSEVTFPILYNVDFGHSDPMITIPNGGWCYINDSRIRFESAVE